MAPTIAAEVGRKSSNAYTVHCNIQRFTSCDVMLLLSSCLPCTKARDLRREKSPSELCLAWPGTGTPRCPEDKIRSQEALDDVVELPDVRSEWLLIKPQGGLCQRMVPCTWVLPLRLIQSATFNCECPPENTAKPGHRDGGGDGNDKGKAGYPQEVQPCSPHQSAWSPNCDWWHG